VYVKVCMLSRSGNQGGSGNGLLAGYASMNTFAAVYIYIYIYVFFLLRFQFDQ
jgi:hypothetical protein